MSQEGTEFGICARENEIKQLKDYITDKVETKKSGIVYMPGGPGTGKSMCIKYVMNRINSIPKLYINCAKIFKPKDIVGTIFDEFGLKQLSRSAKKVSIDDMIERLKNYFSAKATLSHLMVLDELDELPKSNNLDLFRELFSLAEQPDSKLIIVAIANTTDLTSRRDIMNCEFKKECLVTRIVFRPYSSDQLRMILQWYVDNDDRFSDHEIDKNAIMLIAKRFSRLKGDVRGAVNALTSSVQDVKREEKLEDERNRPEKANKELYPTPPGTPNPKTPIATMKRRTTCQSASKSVTKRMPKTLHKSDEMPYGHQITLICFQELCNKSRLECTTVKDGMSLILSVLDKSGLLSDPDEVRAIIDILSTQGVLRLKKKPPQTMISLIVSDVEIEDIVPQRDKIVRLIKALPKL